MNEKSSVECYDMEPMDCLREIKARIESPLFLFAVQGMLGNPLWQPWPKNLFTPSAPICRWRNYHPPMPHISYSWPLLRRVSQYVLRWRGVTANVFEKVAERSSPCILCSAYVAAPPHLQIECTSMRWVSCPTSFPGICCYISWESPDIKQGLLNPLVKRTGLLIFRNLILNICGLLVLALRQDSSWFPLLRWFHTYKPYLWERTGYFWVRSNMAGTFYT